MGKKRRQHVDANKPNLFEKKVSKVKQPVLGKAVGGQQTNSNKVTLTRSKRKALAKVSGRRCCCVHRVF